MKLILCILLLGGEVLFAMGRVRVARDVGTAAKKLRVDSASASTIGKNSTPHVAPAPVSSLAPEKALHLPTVAPNLNGSVSSATGDPAVTEITAPLPGEFLDTAISEVPSTESTTVNGPGLMPSNSSVIEPSTEPSTVNDPAPMLSSPPGIENANPNFDGSTADTTTTEIPSTESTTGNGLGPMPSSSPGIENANQNLNESILNPVIERALDTMGANGSTAHAHDAEDASTTIAATFAPVPSNVSLPPSAAPMPTSTDSNPNSADGNQNTTTFQSGGNSTTFESSKETRTFQDLFADLFKKLESESLLPIPMLLPNITNDSEDYDVVGND